MQEPKAGRPPDLTAVEEIQLVIGAKGGDRPAFEVLVERYHGKAIAVAMGYVRNRDDAAELAQEAFMRAWRGLTGFRDGEPFAPWFFRILRNACLSFLERKKHRRALSIHAPSEDQPGIDVGDPVGRRPDELVDSKDSASAFRAALDRLTLAHREIIVLRHLQELEYSEIAATLNIPIGTVMSRLFHARRKLRELLEPWLPEGAAEPCTPSPKVRPKS
ncbi:MAG: RNA polymerase sigma factor [Planctomycetota bacterium]